MVRATRVGAKAKLEAAQAEIERLKAQLANPQKTASELIADAPNGINIIGGTPESEVKVTGGMTRKQAEEKIFGKKYWVKVTELQLPFAKDVHRVASYCRNGAFEKEFRANTEVLLPESEIKKLQEECVVIDERQVHVGEGGMELAAAKALNTGMELVVNNYGQQFLVRKQPRFHVQILRPEQESIHIS